MGATRYGTVGFVTVYRYYAYPEHIRPRIAQVLILPPFQQMGLGTQLLQAIYREYVGMSEVKDITGNGNDSREMTMFYLYYMLHLYLCIACVLTKLYL